VLSANGRFRLGRFFPGIDTIVRIPLALLGLLIALSFGVVLITVLHSCDFDQYNYSGESNASCGFDEVHSRVTSKGIEIDFEFSVMNYEAMDSVVRTFVLADAGSIAPESGGIWPQGASLSTPISVATQPGKLPSLVDFKEGYRLHIPARQGVSATGTIEIPIDWSGSPPERLSEEPKLTLIVYDVLGNEMLRLEHPYQRSK